MASLFTSQTPSNTNNSDGAPGITTATSIRFAQSGTIDAVRWYCTTNTNGTWIGEVWEITAADGGGGAGTLLASKTLGTTPTSGTWNNITLTSPVSVTTGKIYRIGVYSGDGRYVSSGAFFNGTPLVNGDLTADEDNVVNPPGLTGTMYQGTFVINATPGTYPNGHFNGTSYFIDVVFTASAGATPAPNGIAVTTALGTPSVSLNLTAVPSGIASTVALGTPTVALNRSAAPTGISSSVALGQPNVSSTPGPSGIAVTALLGTPTVALNRSGAPSGIALAVSLGAPAVVILSTPSGISSSVLLGSPSVSATVLTAGAPGSWYGLKVTDDLNRQYAREERGTPLECPNDGEPLQRNPRTGAMQCSYDGWIYQGW